MRDLLITIIGSPIQNSTTTVITTDGVTTTTTITELGLDIEYIAVYLLLFMGTYMILSMFKRLLNLHLRGSK